MLPQAESIGRTWVVFCCMRTLRGALTYNKLVHMQQAVALPVQRGGLSIDPRGYSRHATATIIPVRVCCGQLCGGKVKYLHSLRSGDVQRLGVGFP